MNATAMNRKRRPSHHLSKGGMRRAMSAAEQKPTKMSALKNKIKMASAAPLPVMVTAA